MDAPVKFILEERNQEKKKNIQVSRKKIRKSFVRDKVFISASDTYGFPIIILESYTAKWEN